MRTFSTLIVFAVLLLPGASAQLSPPPGLPPAASEVSLQGYGDHDKTCAEWTDSCRTCRRAEAGDHACSNIGPACQPAAISCARRAEPAK